MPFCTTQSGAASSSGIMQPLMTIIGNLGYVAVCVLGSALAMSGEISFGVIVAFILCAAVLSLSTWPRA